jgi:uracil-DNA glycosylase
MRGRAMSAAREDRLNDPHVRPLMDVVHELRAHGRKVPNVDPNDGGVDARILVLLETPGPRAVESGFVSRDNPDPSAKNIGKVLDAAGLARSDVVLWNAVPYCLSTQTQNRNATAADICEATPACQTFIDRLPRLVAVVFCGRSAQRAQKSLRLPPGVVAFCTFHPGAQAFNNPRCRADINETFEIARCACFKVSQARETSG